MSGSVTDSDACGTDWENGIPQIDSTNENDFIWKPQWKNFRIKLCSQDKVLENPSGYLDPIKIQFLMTHHFSIVQKVIRNLDISKLESINSTEETLEIRLKSLEDEDILTEIESALARETDEIVMKPIQKLKFTSSLVEELFRQELKEKNIALTRDETNIFIVGFEKMKSYICKNIDKINRVTAKKVVKLEDSWKTEAVKCFGIAETISRTFTDVVVRLQEDNSSVYLKGRDITINKAEKEVHKLLSELLSETLHFDPLILKLLMCKDASELLKNTLQKKQLQVVWSVDSTHLYLFSKTKMNTDAVKAVVYENFLATGFSKTSQNENNFCNSSIFVDITKKQNKKLLFLEETNSSVNIAGTKSLMLHLLQQEKLFYVDVEDENCNEKMIMQIADENYLSRLCDIPQDRFQEESSSDSFDIAGATNQPEEAIHQSEGATNQPEEAIHQSEGATNVPPTYNAIYHTESMPMPGPTFPQQPQGDQGQSYCPYPTQRSGQGYPYNNSNQLPPYGGHSSQPVFKRPPSHLDLKIPQSDHEMNRPPPDENVPKIGYPYGPGVFNQHALGEYNPNEPGAYTPQGHCSHSYYGPLEQNLSEKKGPGDVLGPSVQPYPYYPQFFQGYPGYPINPHYPYPRDGDMGTPRPGLGQIPHPPVDLDHINIKSPMHKPYVDTKVQNPEKTYTDSSDRSFKPVGSNNDEGRDFESMEAGREIECFQETSSTNTKENKEDSEQSIKMIKVSNMPSGHSEYSFRYYFENNRKSGGGDIGDFDYDEDSHTAIITFEEEDAVETVMSKTHRFDGHTMDVKRYVKPPPLQYVPKYKDKVFITNISPTTSKDGLENFLELKSKCIPEEIIFGGTENTAIVTFEQPPDMEQLQTVCMRRQLDGSHLSIHTVSITDCIVVTGYKENTSSDTMEYYFDNKRRSGVEGVREVKLMEDDGKFLVYFIDPESALQVCNRQHKLEGRILKVQVYYECLDQDA